MLTVFVLEGKKKPRIVYLSSKNYTSTQAPANYACSCWVVLPLLSHSPKFLPPSPSPEEDNSRLSSPQVQVTCIISPSVDPSWCSDFLRRRDKPPKIPNCDDHWVSMGSALSSLRHIHYVTSISFPLAWCYSMPASFSARSTSFVACFSGAKQKSKRVH